MNASDEATRSLWADVEVAPSARKLTANADADVVVVGAGIAGLSTAYEILQRGLSVVVVDRGKPAGGMTGRTSAHLSAQCDDTFDELIKVRGLDMAKLYFQSHAAAIDRIEDIQSKEKIDCNFRRVNAYLFPGPHEKPKDLTPEFEATRKVGMPIERHVGLPFKNMSDAKCLRYPKQATFHPLRYLRGVAEVILKMGGRICPDTAVMEVEESSSRVQLRTENGKRLDASNAVFCTNSPINDRFALHTKEAPYRTYVITLTIPKGKIEDALYWDTLDPYHYVRLQPGPGQVDYLLVGGSDHKSGEADDGALRFEALESWIRGLLPGLGSVTHRWSGQILDTIDYCAFSGKNPGNERVFVHSGDSGQGITHGVAGGLHIARLISGEDCPWKELFDPSRKTAGGIKNFLAENITALKSFGEYVAPGEVSSTDEIKPGQGAIVREGLIKIAAYRDEKGKLHRRSAKCTHVGCHVHWNSLEKCWDCPCHGSHFAPDGSVLNGPALTPLQSV